jgi:CBS domain-containing protein
MAPCLHLLNAKKETTMLVKECMTKQVELGSPDMTLQEVAQKMRAGDFGALPIAENDRLVGMITDRDITIRGTADGKDPQKARARELMTPNVLYCFEDESLEEVSRNLGDNQIRRLPVLDRQKRLVGVLSLGDLAQSEEMSQMAEEALSRISAANNRQAELRM